MAMAALAALRVRSREAGGQGHSPGLLQTMQAEGDTACGLRAESKAAQTLPLRHPVNVRLLLVPIPQAPQWPHSHSYSHSWGEQFCWGNFIPTPRFHHLPTVNQGAFQPHSRISSLISCLPIL